jgi:hypothetical protein
MPQLLLSLTQPCAAFSTRVQDPYVLFHRLKRMTCGGFTPSWKSNQPHPANNTNTTSRAWAGRVWRCEAAMSKWITPQM